MRQILFLTQTYPRYPADTSGPFIRELAMGLVRAGDAVTVLAPHAPGLMSEWDDDGVAVRTFRYAPERLEVIGYSRTLEADERVRGLAALSTPLYLLGARSAVRRELAKQRYDLVHAHWVVPNLLAASPIGRRQSPSRPLLAGGIHGSDVFLAEQPVVRAWVRRALSVTDLLTGCSPELLKRVVALGELRGHHEVIPYGVDHAEFSPGLQGRESWRKRLSIPTGATVLLSVGRMVSKKGFDVLAGVLPALLDSLPELHVVLAGDGDLRAELEMLLVGSGRVHFPGRVERDSLADLYRTADAFVLPAVHDSKGNVDGLPNVVLEAMASGLPVVSSAISGIPLAIEHGIHGLLVRERNEAELEDALRRVLSSVQTRGSLGRAARRRVEQELTWGAITERYRGAYHRALDAFSERKSRSARGPSGT